MGILWDGMGYDCHELLWNWMRQKKCPMDKPVEPFQRTIEAKIRKPFGRIESFISAFSSPYFIIMSKNKF